MIGVAWFDPAQWQRLRLVVADPSEIEDTFAEWERNAMGAVHTLERQGQEVARVHVDLEALVAWCKGRGVPVNGKARAEYAAFLLQQRQGDQGP